MAVTMVGDHEEEEEEGKKEDAAPVVMMVMMVMMMTMTMDNVDVGARCASRGAWWRRRRT
jgi:hypothetical protein